ncbi:hypothetical protein BDP27DRAFT_1547657 [Rhodocollybia butyracea]|uniref:Uncharacterized protein n=1 Tax=Rhodocollybia butyracea TaxID=206335 RepID=A0A9P5PLD0_9AGAR|nr:hypothetical protein BDP27DRAFT_1547657 [Rhodocollybia butyracea]
MFQLGRMLDIWRNDKLTSPSILLTLVVFVRAAFLNETIEEGEFRCRVDTEFKIPLHQVGGDTSKKTNRFEKDYAIGSYIHDNGDDGVQSRHADALLLLRDNADAFHVDGRVHVQGQIPRHHVRLIQIEDHNITVIGIECSPLQ